eukprot:15482901-Alexandrium_andersonii.AAC.1
MRQAAFVVGGTVLRAGVPSSPHARVKAVLEAAHAAVRRMLPSRAGRDEWISDDTLRVLTWSASVHRAYIASARGVKLLLLGMCWRAWKDGQACYG